MPMPMPLQRRTTLPLVGKARPPAMLVRLADVSDTFEAAQVVWDSLRHTPWHQAVYKNVSAHELVGYHVKELGDHIAQPNKRVLLAIDLAGTVLGLLVYERIGMEDAQVDIKKSSHPSGADEELINEWETKAGPWDAIRSAAEPHFLGLTLAIDPLRAQSGIASRLSRHLAQEARFANVPFFCESPETLCPLFEGVARRNGYRMECLGEPIKIGREETLGYRLLRFLEEVEKVPATA